MFFIGSQMKKQRLNQGVAIVQALCSARDFFFLVIVVEILVEYLTLKKEPRRTPSELGG